MAPRAAAAGSSRVACRVAVIGAGPAGLIAAHECARAGHDVTVYEAGGRLGGVWVFTDEVRVPGGARCSC